MADLIERQAAIDAFAPYAEYESNCTNADWVRRINTVLSALPSAQRDFSEYCDRLWKRAYERGKAEARAEIIRCKDCGRYDGRPCGLVSWYNTADDFCSRPKRRGDERYD